MPHTDLALAPKSERLWDFSMLTTKRSLHLQLTFLALVTLGATLLLAPLQAQSSTYTMTAFTNKSESNMYVYESDNGTDYSLIKGPAFTPPTGLIRDPSVMRAKDGKYWVTYTTNWSANTIGFAVSIDRENWQFSHTYTLPVANLTESWAPEWFVDSDGSVNIIVSLRKSTDGGNFTPSLIKAQNNQFTAWSSPVALRGLSPNYIDTFIIKLGDTYHAMVKNETSKYIEYATATSLSGPYSFKGIGNWAGWGSGNEGPSLIQLDNNKWRILFDCYGCNPQKYYYSDSTDFKTWSAKTELPRLSGFVRHLTVLKENTPYTGEYTRLESFSFPTYFLGHADFVCSIDGGYVNAQDSRWNIVPGLADPKGISLQSVNFPERYLRHYNYQTYLQPNDNSATFKADATFYQRTGLANNQWASYESYNEPGQYLMHRDFKLYIAVPSTQQEKADATFTRALNLTPEPPVVTPPVVDPPVVTPPVVNPPIVTPPIVNPPVVTPPVVEPPVTTPPTPTSPTVEPTTPTTAGAIGLWDFIGLCAGWFMFMRKRPNKMSH